MTQIDTHKNAMTREERIAIITERDGPNCYFPDCGKPFIRQDDITFDHWIPQSKGGTWHVDNLRLMHKRCNALKGDRMPNPDGTLPPLPRELRPQAVDKSTRIPVCDTCASGRLLLKDEICEICGSGPQPASHPKYLQRKPAECEHGWGENPEEFCWYCTLGFVERKPAIQVLLEGP